MVRHRRRRRLGAGRGVAQQKEAGRWQWLAEVVKSNSVTGFIPMGARARRASTVILDARTLLSHVAPI
jgi:hypothetical protein